MARPGAFSANFHPELLDAFRKRCSEKGQQYTKVLGQLAEIYLATDGEVLNDNADIASTKVDYIKSTPSALAATNNDLEKRLDRVEESNEYFEEALVSILKRIDTLEKINGLGAAL